MEGRKGKGRGEVGREGEGRGGGEEGKGREQRENTGDSTLECRLGVSLKTCS